MELESGVHIGVHVEAIRAGKSVMKTPKVVSNYVLIDQSSDASHRRELFQQSSCKIFNFTGSVKFKLIFESREGVDAGAISR